MYNVKKISGLYGIVGLQNPANPEYQILDSDNQVSASGRFVTDYPFCSLEYIINNFPYKGASDADINLYLKNTQIASIRRVMDKVFNQPDFNDRQLVYQHAQNKIDLESLPTGFIGFEIDVCRDKSLVFEITRCILEFDGAGDIDLLLFNSSSRSPIKSQTITIDDDLVEVELGWRMDNTDGTYKGKYYLGYVADGISVTPFKRNYESSNVVSNIDGVSVDEIIVGGHTDKSRIFDLLDVSGTGINSGLNPEVSTFDDHTQTILSNKALFASAIEKQFAIDLLSGIIASSRFNNSQRSSKDMLTMMTIELEGIDQEDGIKKSGLKRELMGDINHIRKEVNRLRKNFNVTGFVLNQR